MPEDAAAGVRARDWRILIDVNAHEDVDKFFRRAGAVVFPARTIFAKGTPDFEIDKYAQELGCIIVSHERQFMKLIQRRVYQRDISAATGYGRILLCGSEKRQSRRLQEVLPLLRLYHR